MSSVTSTPADLTTTYAQVLMPVDFSPLSWKVLSLARTMERVFGVPRRLVHIDTASPWLDEGASQLTLQAGPSGQHLPVEVVAARTAADGIVRALGDDEASLLVMSTHGHTAAGELPFGSTTEAVLRTWTGPMLLAGPHFKPVRPVVQRMVLCVEPEVPPPAALVADVSAWGRRFDVPVDVVFVHERSLDKDLHDVQAERRDVESFVAKLRDDRVRSRVVTLRGARVAHQITSYADAHPGTVIALATHARGLSARLLLGSVAMSVVRHAASPVLLRRFPPHG